MSKSFTLPAKADQHIYRGDTIIIEAAINQGGEPINITGYSIWFTAKPNIANNDGTSGVVQKTLVSGIAVTDAPTGRIRITIAPADTAQISQTTTYECDVQVKSPSGEVTTAARGTMKVELDVTQSTT